MRKRTVIISAVVAASLIAPIADAFRIAPLATRDGVVVTWRAKNRVAVVAQPGGRLLAIHALRRVTPGTRVTVQGVKWGTPTRGIKWTRPPSGIKWGIKWGRNGSYQSGVRRSTKRAVWTPVRGPIIKKFGRKAVAIGAPGGIVVVRIAALRRGSEGLPGQKSINASELPPVGATVSLRVFFGKGGVKIGRSLRYLKPPIPGASLPVAGTIVAIDPVARTLVVEDSQDRAYRVRVKVTLPPELSIASLKRGQEVAVEGTLVPGGSLSATLVGPNGSFAQADDPAAVQILTTGQPSCTAALETVCPPGSSPAPPSGTNSAATPGGGAPPPPSSSTPPPPSPPSSGGTPPDPPPAPSPPPDPGTDPDDDDDGPPPPPVCRPPQKHGHKGGKPWSHRRPKCCWAKEDDARAWKTRCDKGRRLMAILRKTS